MDSAGGRPEHGIMKPFGIDFSEEDIVDLFATCIFCLNHAIDKAPSATEALKLSVIRLRLTRWGEAVKISEKPSLDHYYPSPDEVCTTKQTLVDIITLFDIENPSANATVMHRNDTDKEAQLLQESLGAIASERLLGGNSLLGSQFLGLCRWSEEQYKCASTLIFRLENLFGSEHLRELCAIERLRITEGAIERLRTIVKGLDPWMSDGTSVIYNYNNYQIYQVVGHTCAYNRPESQQY